MINLSVSITTKGPFVESDEAWARRAAESALTDAHIWRNSDLSTDFDKQLLALPREQALAILQTNYLLKLAQRLSEY